MSAFFWLQVCVVFAAGLVVGVLVSRGKARLAVAAAAIIGLLTGLILGLSSSPILATGIAAVIGLLGTLLTPLVEAKKLALRQEDARQRPVPGPLGWHPFTPSMIVPFVAMVIVGLLLGITLRVNDLLDFREKDLRVNLREMGLSERQVETVLDKYVSSGMAHSSVANAVKREADDHAGTSLLNKVAEPAKWEPVWRAVSALDNDSERITFLLKSAPEADKKAVRESIDDRQRAIVEELRKACGEGSK